MEGMTSLPGHSAREESSTVSELTPSSIPVSNPTPTDGGSQSNLNTPSQTSSSTRNQQQYSCLQCKHRKVKCDRMYPCSHCLKTRNECVYRAPPPPRRKRQYRLELVRGGSSKANIHHDPEHTLEGPITERERGLLHKIKKYEDLLIDLGALRKSTVGGSDEREMTLPFRDNSTPPSDTLKVVVDVTEGEGKMYSGSGKSKYLENNLWTSAINELHDPNEVLEELSDSDSDTEDEDEDEAELEYKTTTAPQMTRQGSGMAGDDYGDMIFPLKSLDDTFNLRDLHPPPVQIFMLWQVYIDNVSPLYKILHLPTTQKALLNATADLDNISKSMEALLFAIYVIAVATMDEEQCRDILHESKVSAFERLERGARKALRKAGVLRTNELIVLQAYVLFLLSVEQQHDNSSLWCLTGAAMRIGQRLGLHRDGSKLKLPVFEAEMRRRLWLNMVQFDSRVGTLCGSGLSVMPQFILMESPKNVNDSDIWPDMREPPVEREGPTEMMFLLIRAEFSTFLQKVMPADSSFDGAWSQLTNPSISTTEKMAAINELEQTLQTKFVRYCNPEIPLHYFCSNVVEGSICRMRLVAFLPRHSINFDSENSEPAQPSIVTDNILYESSLRLLQLDTRLRTSPLIRGFVWHIDRHFQWHALICLLTQIRSRASSFSYDDVAWTTLDRVFANHPELNRGHRSRSKLAIAVRNLVVRAWEACEYECQRSGDPTIMKTTPSCVKQIQEKMFGKEVKSRHDSLANTELLKPSNINSQDSAIATYTTGTKISSLASTIGHNNDQGSTATTSGNQLGDMSMDVSAIGWEHWNSMCQEFEMQDQWDNIAFGSAEPFSNS